MGVMRVVRVVSVMPMVPVLLSPGLSGLHLDVIFQAIEQVVIWRCFRRGEGMCHDGCKAKC
jgi:hypothetical protein